VPTPGLSPTLRSCALRGGSQLRERSLLDLSHPLGAEAEALADLREPLGFPLAEAEARLDHLPLAIAESREQAADLLARDRVEHPWGSEIVSLPSFGRPLTSTLVGRRPRSAALGGGASWDVCDSHRIVSEVLYAAELVDD
jgi:hypothetical protein